MNPDDPRIMLMRQGVCNPDKISMIDVLRVTHMSMCSFIMDDDQFVIAGGKIVNDMSNMTMSHFTQITPTIMKKMGILSQVRKKLNSILKINLIFINEGSHSNEAKRSSYY